MENNRTEMYSFTMIGADGATTTVSFNCPTDGVRIQTFHDFCKRAAAAFGWCEDNIEEFFGETNLDAGCEFDV